MPYIYFPWDYIFKIPIWLQQYRTINYVNMYKKYLLCKCLQCKYQQLNNRFLTQELSHYQKNNTKSMWIVKLQPKKSKGKQSNSIFNLNNNNTHLLLLLLLFLNKELSSKQWFLWSVLSGNKHLKCFWISRFVVFVRSNLVTNSIIQDCLEQERKTST